ncbi:ATP-dependent sacrificial sulfur transferase LarE [Planctomycetota bacterium]|nr:ATP-dependent sacrificial sulfur transferase LarE [Planctomycetota bacterium]
MPETNTQNLLDSLTQTIRQYPSLLTAFSAGIDSTLIAVLARQTLGRDLAPAAIADSPSLPRYELEQARLIAQDHDIKLIIVEPDEIQDEQYQANDSQRCYYCKSHLYNSLHVLADDLGITHIANGTNRDDFGDHRPGLTAASQANIVSPLAEAGLDKAQIRAVAKLMGIENWDKPAAACLSSRIAYGLQVTPERLSQVEKAENHLRNLGFNQFRVRHHDTIARIELPETDLINSIQDKDLRNSIITGIKAAGFTYVSLDLEGFRSGSGNLVLTINQTNDITP